MGKKRKKNIIIVSVILIIALAGIIAFSSDAFFASTYSPSTLALSKVSLKSDYSNLNYEDAFLITFTLGQTESQSYSGSFSSSEINQKTDNEVGNGFSIEVDFEDQKCEYNIETINTNYGENYVYENLEEYTWNCGLSFSVPDVSTARAESGFGAIIIRGNRASGLRRECFVVGTDNYHLIGSLESPIINQKYDVTLSTADGTDTKSLSTIGRGAIEFGDYAYATYQGGSATAFTCQSESIDEDNYIPIYYNGKWIITSKNTYNIYDGYFGDYVDVGSKEDEVSEFIDRVNIWSSRVLAGSSLDGEIENKYSQSSGKLITTLESPVFLPITSLYIKASTLDILTKVPSFEFGNVYSSEFQYGDSGYVSAEVRNVGNEKGSATLYLDCSGNVFESNDNEIVSLDAGDSDTYYLKLTGMSTQDESEYCDVYLNYLGTTISKPVKVSGTVIQQCTPNEISCGVEEGKEVVKKCNSVGSSSPTIQYCSSDQECSGGKCVDEGDGDVPTPTLEKCESCEDFAKSKLIGGLFESQKCEKKLIHTTVTCLFSFFKLLAVPIFFIFGLILGVDLFKKIPLVKRNEWLAWILSLFVSGILAYFLYTLWSVGIWLAIGYLVLRIVLTFIPLGKVGKISKGGSNARK